MSEPIKVGDLVQVVHECCPTGSVLGRIFTVMKMGTYTYRYCYCGWKASNLSGAQVNGQDVACSFPASWLKRIPPLEELEGEQRKEEIYA